MDTQDKINYLTQREGEQKIRNEKRRMIKKRKEQTEKQKTKAEQTRRNYILAKMWNR